MSEKTLRETYGHHHPDHLHGAANAIGTHAAPKKNVSLLFLWLRKERGGI
ncbi:hypothetical protein [Bradyrhizobium sp. CCGB01]|nr:hypothetical protein [Bradyrhizobium sp. CCGB01]MCP3405660.1 hypothetical protein [Bradyrhizobium sp. CCGB01]